jgi:hypothetical protein
MAKLPFDPVTVRKAIIGSVNDSTTPPTVSLNISGDTETLVSQVRTLNNFTPLPGQTVLLAKQGAEIFLLGAIAGVSPYTVNSTADNGWQLAILAGGLHGPNSLGNVYYRRVLDHGSWKMQWRGGWDPQGGTTMITALDPDYRPSARRSVSCARNPVGQNSVTMNFDTSGICYITGDTTAPSASTSVTVNTGGPTATNSTSPNGGTSSADLSHNHADFDASGATGVTSLTHTHTIFVDSHNHGISTHSHTGSGSTTVTTASPTWVSLNGVEYFL